MQPSFWRTIRQAVAQWRVHAMPSHPLTPGEWAGRVWQLPLLEVAGLVQRSNDPHYSQCDCALAVALIVLGPDQDGDPPLSMWAALCILAQREYTTADPAQLLELVVAWGCGWQRITAGPTGTWGAVWEGAVFALSTLVLRSARKTVLLLLDLLADRGGAAALSRLLARPTLLPSFPVSAQAGVDDVLFLATGDLGLYVNEMTLELIQPWESDQALRQHPKRHLSSWQPRRLRLRVFVAAAVRGNAGPTIKGEAFQHSLFFPLLADDFGLRVEPVLYQVCHGAECNGALISQARAAGRQIQVSAIRPGSLYEGARCPICRTPADQRRTYAVARRHWVIVPQDRGGAYMPKRFWHCIGCKTLFPISQPYLYIKELIREIEEQVKTLRARPDDQLAYARLESLVGAQPDLIQLVREARRRRRLLDGQREAMEAQLTCPLCGHRGLPERVTHVWVYAPRAHTDLLLTGET